MQVTQAPGLEAGRAAAASPADTTPPPVLDGVMPRAADAATRPRSAERLANVERLRIVAMLEIVTFHVGGALDTDDYRLPVVAGLGLPVFLLLNNAFNCTLAERRGTRAFLDAKVSRLLLPWLVWSVVYAGVVLAERVRHGEAVVAVFSWRTILGGTYTHLWFVPFALFGSLLIAGLQVETRSASHRRVAWLALAAGSLVVALAALLLALTDAEWPLLQWLFALPSPLLGFALGRVLLANEPRLSHRLAVLLSAVAIGAVGWSAFGPFPEMGRRYAVAMALVAVLFTWPGRSDALSRRLAPLLFGIYLTHPLILRLYQAAHLPYVHPALLGALLFAASALLVEVLRRTPLRGLV